MEASVAIITNHELKDILHTVWPLAKATQKDNHFMVT